MAGMQKECLTLQQLHASKQEDCRQLHKQLQSQIGLADTIESELKSMQNEIRDIEASLERQGSEGMPGPALTMMKYSCQALHAARFESCCLPRHLCCALM